jgi:methionine synthase II (cobalamin-independent)
MLFRADHIGSLLRPKKLREAFRTGKDLKHVQDESVRDVVRLQQECGLQLRAERHIGGREKR